MARSKQVDPRRPPAPTRRDSEQIVDAIVEATLRAGDPEISVNDIAERAGVGIASVYRYFSGKPAIYAEISRRLQREFLARLRSLLARPELGVDEAIEGICRLAVVVPNATPALRRNLNFALPLSWSEESARDTFATAIDEIVAWFATHLASPPTDLAHRVFVVFSAGRGTIMMSQMMPERAPDQDEMLRQLVAIARFNLKL